MTRFKPYLVFSADRPVESANENGLAKAGPKSLAAFELSGVQHAPAHDLLIFVDAGTVEFVIGGTAGIVATGGCVQVPAGAPYAYRNVAAVPAIIVIRPLVRALRWTASPDQGTTAGAALPRKTRRIDLAAPRRIASPDQTVEERMGAAGSVTQHDDGKRRLLASHPLFAGLPEDLLAEVAKISRRQVWPAGKLIFQRGDGSAYLIAVERGHIKISLQTSGGREFALQHMRGGSIVGEIGALDGSARTADAIAVDETIGYVLERRSFVDLATRRPELAFAAIRHLCALVRYTTDHIETIALYGLEARLARFLLATRSPRDDEEAPERHQFALDISQSEIAELLGASRPKVNQAFKALERAGAVTRAGQVLTCDRDKLLSFAAPDD